MVECDHGGSHSDPILVTEDQLARAIDTVVSVCERYRSQPEVSVGQYRDAELGEGAITMIWVHLKSEPTGDYYQLLGEVARSLRAAHLYEPWLRLSAHLIPAW